MSQECGRSSRWEPIRLTPQMAAKAMADGSWQMQSSTEDVIRHFGGAPVLAARCADGGDDAALIMQVGPWDVHITGLSFLQVNYYTIIAREMAPRYTGVRRRPAFYVFVQPEHRDLVRREQLERNEERLHVQGLLHEKAVADVMARKSYEAQHCESYEGQLLVPPQDFVAQLKRGTCLVRHGLSAVPKRMAGQIVVDASLAGDRVRIVTLEGTLEVSADRICSPRGQTDIHVLQWNDVVTSKPKKYGGGQRVSRLYGTSVVLRDLAWHLTQPNPYRYQERIDAAHAEYKQRHPAALDG